MEVTYNSHNFPIHFGRDFHGANQLNFSVQELMWSALTVGRANFIGVLQHGLYSEYELLYRASILFANLGQDGNNLIKSSAYEHLDPSEKSAVSYFLGLTFTKLLSERLLNIPWLLHIDVYRDQFERDGQAFGFGSSRVRPDLIGLNDRRLWVVMEAKGRTNYMENTLLTHAKNQTRNLRRIGIDYPSLRVAVVTHFLNGRLIIDWADPDGFNEAFFDIKTNVEEYLINYYKLIFNILTNNRTVDFGEYIIFTFKDINITIGLEKKIFEAYGKQKLGEVEPTRILSFEQFSEISDHEFFVGKDGVVVGLGMNWRELMQTNKKFNE